ncbi:hypothetical protein BD408DRAFT_425064 [Parasitella parasitica]|nr:hypothetical protein BD408DRAFT_425064 [Parasitella parasitica]
MNMNIQTLKSQKSYPDSNKNSRSYLNACPSDEAGLLRYSSSPPPPPPVAAPSLYSYHREATLPSSTATDLQSVVSKYHANPELLKLILASKVEEDKRRTEEAKLKAKELDLYFKNQQECYKPNRNHQQEAFTEQRRRRRSSSSSNSSASSSSHNNSAGNSTQRRIAPYAIPRPIVMSPPSRRNSSASAILSINQLSINNAKCTQPFSSSAPANANLFPPATALSFNNSRLQENAAKISRRRRSMQAITKIVETTEFPYDDRHFWKNNGNTVQKKTGCKSVYYKCANSCKGCPVNKTVVEQPDGSYIIKYRGDHISECSQVEHIRDL